MLTTTRHVSRLLLLAGLLAAPAAATQAAERGPDSALAAALAHMRIGDPHAAARGPGNPEIVAAEQRRRAEWGTLHTRDPYPAMGVGGHGMKERRAVPERPVTR